MNTERNNPQFSFETNGEVFYYNHTHYDSSNEFMECKEQVAINMTSGIVLSYNDTDKHNTFDIQYIGSQKISSTDVFSLDQSLKFSNLMVLMVVMLKIHRKKFS